MAFERDEEAEVVINDEEEDGDEEEGFIDLLNFGKNRFWCKVTVLL